MLAVLAIKKLPQTKWKISQRAIKFYLPSVSQSDWNLKKTHFWHYLLMTRNMVWDLPQPSGLRVLGRARGYSVMPSGSCGTWPTNTCCISTMLGCGGTCRFFFFTWLLGKNKNQSININEISVRDQMTISSFWFLYLTKLRRCNEQFDTSTNIYAADLRR